MKKEFSIFFFYIMLQKQPKQSHVLIKDMLGMGKESITLSMELAKTQCYLRVRMFWGQSFTDYKHAGQD